ncbi:hypothetical protein LINPERPRIM_LOCUS14932 [Linum perenne]
MADFLESVDDEETVMRESEALQLQYGVEMPIEDVPPNPRERPIRIVEYKPRVLGQIWASFTDAEKWEFNSRYGCLFDLLNVPFPDTMIRELLNYWDPHFHCFTLNDVDISPLVEEYYVILRIARRSTTKVYVHNPSAKAVKALSVILQLRKEQLRNELQLIEDVECISDRVVHEYPEWQQNRGTRSTPQVVDQKCKRKIGTSNEHSSGVSFEEYAELEEKLEDLRWENRKISKEKNFIIGKMETENKGLKEKVRDMEKQGMMDSRTIGSLRGQVLDMRKEMVEIRQDLENERKENENLEGIVARAREDYEQRNRSMRAAKGLMTDASRRAHFIADDLSFFMQQESSLEVKGSDLWSYLVDLEEELAFYGKCPFPK